MQAILLTKIGDVGGLKIKEVEDPKPKKHEVLVKHTAIGINFFDICLRRGQYKFAAELPVILGNEACGIVEAIGSEVRDFKVGDRVAYATGPMGAYAQKRAIDQKYLIIVPKNLTDVQVAGCLLKGLMAHTLLFRVYLARRAKKILIHSAAGGLGQLLCQWSRALGIEVIGTVGSDAKISAALANGCHHVINYKKNDFLQELGKITQNNGVGMVLDGVGKDSLEKSMACLWPMGICISYGESSGNTAPLDLNSMALNSTFLTRPTMALYKSNRVELALGAYEVFNGMVRGFLKPQITTYNFKDVQKAHKALENRETTGSLVLTF